MFALGLLSWLYNRPTEGTESFLHGKFAKKPEILKANLAAFHAGWAYGETTEDFAVSYEVAAAPMPPGTYRNITGNTALAYGLVAGARRAGRPLVLGAYPITPASDVLHTLSGLKAYGVTTLQAEDEIAGIGAALGASFGGAIGVTTTSGPGVALKAETIGLAVSLEPAAGDLRRAARRPLDRAAHQDRAVRPAAGDVRPQRRGAGADRGAPLPADCFDAAIEAVRIATTYRTPVFLLSDGYLANGSEPWRVPTMADLPDITVEPDHRAERHGRRRAGRRAAVPAVRARPRDARPALGGARHARPRAPHRRHREGRPHRRHRLRPGQPRPHGAAAAGQGRRHRPHRAGHLGRRPPRPGRRPRRRAGARLGLDVRADQRRRPRRAGPRGLVAQAHLRHLNPFPSDLGDVLRRYRRVLVPEMNLGRLSMLLRARYLVDVQALTQVRGLPFTTHEPGRGDRRAGRGSSTQPTPPTAPTRRRTSPTSDRPT
ncbi:hypothetical protein GCM10025868_31230 [Angustibacter aerolatus]|uniref:Pyruvate flavodoxin/ferredoxin oxidoreductase pyrimidine binding domain-containing protein n=1 Tax=Angustibacter aerolatus TaxID=1162965 RepID=A0ABQ6JKD6_9ACTN|nr:hypothetical protein [Angustibacter aerolatus]GMA87873.1 hypothetical protein GCM10025868_31230 [Angustibacter aerolatus]